MIRRRTLLAGGLAGLAGLGLAACSKNDAASPGGGDKVTVGLTYIPNVQFCAFYLAKAEGLFDGVDVEIRHHGEQEDLFGALLRGQEQVVFASSDEAVIANQGLVTVATAYQTYPIEVLFTGQANSLQDLRGKSIGIPGRFGSSYYSALVALESAGLTEEEVELKEIGFTQVSAMATNQVDAITGFTNNELVQLNLMGIEISRVPIATEKMMVGPSLITTSALAEDPKVKAVVAGMLEAERRVVADQSAGIAATKEFVPALSDAHQLEMAEQVLAATAKLWLDEQGEVSVDVDQQAMARMTEFLTRAKLVNGS